MSQADKIRSINDPGWDGVNANVQQLKVNNNSGTTNVQLNSEEGAKVLTHLRSVTIEQPAWMPGADASFGYSREGQNSLIREIELRIRRANGTTS